MLSKLRKNLPTYIILTLATVFVLYHIVSVSLGIDSFAQALQAGANDSGFNVQVESNQTEQDLALVNEDKSKATTVNIGLNYVASYWPTRIVIDKVNIDLPLIGSMESQGDWDVSETGANYAINTAMPNGQSGNTVIFGHDRPQLFHDIHELEVGDVITVMSQGHEYKYRVSGSKVVQPTDVSVMNQTVKPTLTLITCDGWLSQDRFIITAEMLPTS